MPFDFAAINYLAVLVAGIVTFLLGGAWYTALFGKLWLKLHGYTEEQVKAMQAKRPPIVFFGGMVVAYLVIALAMALLLSALGVANPTGGACIGLVVAVIVAAVGFTGHLASIKHVGILGIDVLFQLIYLVGMGALLGAWH